MNRVSKMFAVAAVTGLFTAPAWAQERPSSKQSTYPSGYSGRVESGEDQNMPPATGQSDMTRLAKSDMRKAEEALKAKGHNPGRVDGVIDDQTRAAIRDFQQDNRIPVAGSLDHETARKLGLSGTPQSGGMSSGDTSRSTTERLRSGTGYSGRVDSREDQNFPPGGEWSLLDNNLQLSNKRSIECMEEKGSLRLPFLFGAVGVHQRRRSPRADVVR